MKRVLLSLQTLCLTAALLSGCSEAELPQRSLQADDCLREVQLEQLDAALSRCDRVVAQYPNDPAPRNERSLLLALKGDDAAACREIEAAHKLAQQQGTGKLDPMLVSELSMRRRSCQSGS